MWASIIALAKIVIDGVVAICKTGKSAAKPGKPVVVDALQIQMDRAAIDAKLRGTK